MVLIDHGPYSTKKKAVCKSIDAFGLPGYVATFKLRGDVNPKGIGENCERTLRVIFWYVSLWVGALLGLAQCYHGGF